MAQLDKLRTELMASSTVTLQRFVRGWLARKRYRRVRKAVVMLQVHLEATLVVLPCTLPACDAHVPLRCQQGSCHAAQVAAAWPNHQQEQRAELPVHRPGCEACWQGHRRATCGGWLQPRGCRLPSEERRPGDTSCASAGRPSSSSALCVASLPVRRRSSCGASSCSQPAQAMHGTRQATCPEPG